MSQRTIDVDGERYGLLAHGDPAAPLVLCLHGFPDCPWSFDAVLRAVAAAGFHAVAPWMRGYAPSPTTGPFDLSTLATAAVRLIDALDAERAFVVGHDWGSLVTFGLLREHAPRVQAAVLLSVPHPAVFLKNALRSPTQLARSSYMAAFQVPALPERLLRAGGFWALRKLWRSWSPGFEPGEHYWAELERCLTESMPAPLEYYRTLPRQLGQLRGLSEPVRVPVLYLHGARDGCVAPGAADGQEPYFDHRFRAETLANVGHFLQLEAPSEIAYRIIKWARSHS